MPQFNLFLLQRRTPFSEGTKTLLKEGQMWAPYSPGCCNFYLNTAFTGMSANTWQNALAVPYHKISV